MVWFIIKSNGIPGSYLRNRHVFNQNKAKCITPILLF